MTRPFPLSCTAVVKISKGNALTVIENAFNHIFHKIQIHVQMDWKVF